MGFDCGGSERKRSKVCALGHLSGTYSRREHSIPSRFLAGRPLASLARGHCWPLAATRSRAAHSRGIPVVCGKATGPDKTDVDPNPHRVRAPGVQERRRQIRWLPALRFTHEGPATGAARPRSGDRTDRPRPPGRWCRTNGAGATLGSRDRLRSPIDIGPVSCRPGEDAHARSNDLNYGRVDLEVNDAAP